MPQFTEQEVKEALDTYAETAPFFMFIRDIDIPALTEEVNKREVSSLQDVMSIIDNEPNGFRTYGGHYL